MNETNEEKVWRGLTKKYLTVDQKKKIIQEYLTGKSQESLLKTAAEIKEMLDRKNK